MSSDEERAYPAAVVSALELRLDGLTLPMRLEIIHVRRERHHGEPFASRWAAGTKHRNASTRDVPRPGSR